MAAVNFDNVFSADYDSYKVICKVNTSTSLAILARFRTSGSSNTTLNYRQQDTTYSGATLSTSRGSFGSSIQIGNTAPRRQFQSFEIINPFKAEDTGFLAFSVEDYGDTPLGRISSGGFRGTTVFDGIELFTSTGTITGTIDIWGYKFS